MNTSIFLARVLGLYCFIVSMVLFYNRQSVKAMIMEMVSQRAVFFLVAIITLIFGILLVVSHNIWVLGWPVVITLMAWVALLSGVIRLAFPDYIQKRIGMWPLERVVTGGAIVMLIIGIFLLYHGYIAMG